MLGVIPFIYGQKVRITVTGATRLRGTRPGEMGQGPPLTSRTQGAQVVQEGEALVTQVTRVKQAPERGWDTDKHPPLHHT